MQELKCAKFETGISATMMTEQDFVKRCLEDICAKNDFGERESMTQRNFEMLSDEIRAKTGIQLSISTLKRLLHGEFSRIPQQTTLNAISGYLGFKTWQEYRNSVQETEPKIVSAPPQAPPRTSDNSLINWNRIAISLFVVAVVGFLGFSKRAPGSGYNRATFSATKTTPSDIPNTVVFSYDVTHVKADSFFIQQSWDRNRRVKVSRNNHTLTDIYYEPGYHLAKLIANDSVIKTFGVGIPTDKWIYYAKEKFTDVLPKYVDVASENKGYLGMERSEVVNSLIDVGQDHTYFNCYFPTKYGGSADNFILKYRARVVDVKNNACPFLMYEVFSQNRFMAVKTTPPGCANEMALNFGDVVLSGKSTDLSALSMDVKDWQDVEFTVRDKHVTIRINGVDRYSTRYKISPGVITGLGFISNGLCQVDFVELTDLSGRVFYSNNFDAIP